jgi:hypothetical protein
MATYHGKNCYFELTDGGGTARSIGTDLQDAAFAVELPDVKSTGFTDSWDESLVGIPGYKINIGGNWTDTSNTGTAVVLDSLIGASQRYFRLAPGGSATGQRCYTGSIIMTSYNVTVPVAGKVSVTANFVGTGVMTGSTM